jgi:hypothetical protein
MMQGDIDLIVVYLEVANKDNDLTVVFLKKRFDCSMFHLDFLFLHH